MQLICASCWNFKRVGKVSRQIKSNSIPATCIVSFSYLIRKLSLSIRNIPLEASCWTTNHTCKWKKKMLDFLNPRTYCKPTILVKMQKKTLHLARMSNREQKNCHVWWYFLHSIFKIACFANYRAFSHFCRMMSVCYKK